MMVGMKNRLGVLVVAAGFIFASSSAGRAEGLFRLFPESQMNGFYSDNIPLRTNNEVGDFGSSMVFGFYGDYTSAARYASLHYDTFVQLYTHQTRLDRAGEGQYLSATDDENLSPTTKLHFDELFYRDATSTVAVTTSDQAPQFNSVLALIVLADFQASINQFHATLTHNWGHKWSSLIGVHQTTFWSQPTNSSTGNHTSYFQGITTETDYHFTSRFSLGVGYRFYDFRFTLPGAPDQQAHWPYAHVVWQPTENLYLSGIMGLAVSHSQGNNSDQVNPAGTGQAEYHFKRGRVYVYGGQEPFLTSVFGSVGNIRQVNGSISYDLTQRITATAGGGYFELNGSDFNGKFAAWGVGFSDRLNRWVSANVRFVQLRRSETGQSQFIPSGNQNGQWATGNYFIVGLAASFEAFRWSWQ